VKRTVVMLAAFAAMAFLAAAAQAAVKGEEVFKSRCAMCHSVKGKGGSLGPDLTKISSRLRENDIRMKLENPKKGNPSSMMPSFSTLSKDDMTGLLGYLKNLK